MTTHKQAMQPEELIDQLRGQLQNCVSHLEGAVRRGYIGNRLDSFNDAILGANKALYDSLHAQLAKPDDDTGPWFIRSTQSDKMRICSHDFTHDAELELSGDFSDRESRDRYAQRIADRLNAGVQP